MFDLHNQFVSGKSMGWKQKSQMCIFISDLKSGSF